MLNNSKPSRYLTVKEVAEYFNKHPRTIYRWIEDKKLPARKDPGGHGWMIVLEEEAKEEINH